MSDRGSNLAVPYAFLTSLYTAPAIPGGIYAFAVFWAVCVFRHTSKPRTSGANLEKRSSVSEP